MRGWKRSGGRARPVRSRRWRRTGSCRWRGAAGWWWTARTRSSRPWPRRRGKRRGRAYVDDARRSVNHGEDEDASSMPRGPVAAVSSPSHARGSASPVERRASRSTSQRARPNSARPPPVVTPVRPRGVRRSNAWIARTFCPTAARALDERAPSNVGARVCVPDVRRSA